jgi:hypothetical protein
MHNGGDHGCDHVAGLRRAGGNGVASTGGMATQTAVYRCSGLAPGPTLEFLKLIGWRISSRYGLLEE